MGLGIKSRIQTHLHAVKIAYTLAPTIKTLFENYSSTVCATALYRSPRKGYLRNGLVIEGSPHTSMVTLVRDVFLANAYTPDFLPISPNDIVVDIGANIGVFSLFAARLTKNKVLAYEPDPECHRYLVRNVSMNGFRNIHIFNEAVAEATGTARLYLFKNAVRNSLWDHKGRGRKGISVEVPKVSLHDVFVKNSLDRIDFLKMDCEGAEFPVLLNAKSEDLKRIQKISMESHDIFTSHRHEELESLFKESGFNFKTIEMNYQDGIMYAWRDD